MNKTKPLTKLNLNFAAALATYIVLSGLDAGLTYLATPDLFWEGNPLVRIFGLGWTALIVVNIVVFIPYSFLMYVAIFKYERVHIPCTSFREYTSMLFFGRPNVKNPFLALRTPNNFSAYAAALCFAIMMSMVIMRSVLIMEWASSLHLWGRGWAVAGVYRWPSHSNELLFSMATFRETILITSGWLPSFNTQRIY